MPIKDPVKAKEYHEKYHKEWYKKNKKKQIEKQKKLRFERRKWLNEYKASKGCSKCGFNENSVALDFHHCTGKKENSLCHMADMNGIEKIKEEVEKCIVLCRNCHAILHWSSKTAPPSSTG